MSETDVLSLTDSTTKRWIAKVAVPDEIRNDPEHGIVCIPDECDLEFERYPTGEINLCYPGDQNYELTGYAAAYDNFRSAVFEHYADSLAQMIGQDLEQEPEIKKPSIGVTPPPPLSKPGERKQSKTSLSM